MTKYYFTQFIINKNTYINSYFTNNINAFVYFIILIR